MNARNVAGAGTDSDAGVCPWALQSAIERDYHDSEWGRPRHDDRALFESLCLEGAQAGLSWRTILAKREHYREVFDGFDAERMARYDAHKIEALLADSGIVRNRLKVQAFVTNAQAYLAMRERGETLDAWLWQWVEGRPLVGAWRTREQVPPRTELSDQVSKALKKAGFKFVGSTIVYAFLQTNGLVNDHLVDCPSYSVCLGLSGR